MYKFLNDQQCSDIIKRFNLGENRNILSLEYDVSHKTISNIIERNGSPRQKGNKKYLVDEYYFQNIDDEYKAYWLGFLYADGYVMSKGKAFITGMTLKDLDHIIKFKNQIKSNGEIKKATTPNNYSFNIYNTTFSRHLISNGCIPNKTYKITFPKLENNLARHFIRGFFDGDGNITCTENTLQITICCASFIFISQIIDIMKINLSFNRDPKVYRRKDGLYIFVNSSDKDIMNIYNFLYQDSNIFLDRKKAIFEIIKSDILNIKKIIGKNQWKKRAEREKKKKLNMSRV